MPGHKGITPLQTTFFWIAATRVSVHDSALRRQASLDRASISIYAVLIRIQQVICLIFFPPTLIPDPVNCPQDKDWWYWGIFISEISRLT